MSASPSLGENFFAFLFHILWFVVSDYHTRTFSIAKYFIFYHSNRQGHFILNVFKYSHLQRSPSLLDTTKTRLFQMFQKSFSIKVEPDSTLDRITLKHSWCLQDFRVSKPEIVEVLHVEKT